MRSSVKTKKDLYTIHRTDARDINKLLTKKLVDVTITSPPYFDLKDYGYKNQIGYGQKYEEYLEDLKTVFKNVYDCTKDSGTLWVIIDCFKRNGEVIPLPFDFSNKIKDTGWKLQEVIIWGKDRTVPWTHKGQMRNLFEYILMFSKSKNYNFYIDQIRDFESLKKWWVKYPERYNPKGKTPDAIWHFDIPTQGSWGNGYIKHFCPLPEEMIAQILKLTTREGDIVLDPFAGSGAVLSKANNMKRKHIGFELNSEYIKMFNDYILNTGLEKRKEYEKRQVNTMDQDRFKKLVIDLRILKYARVLYQKLNSENIFEILKIYVEKTRTPTKKKNALVSVNYYFLIPSKNKNKKKLALLMNTLKSFIEKAPLSKFGIEPSFIIITKINDFLGLIDGNNIYTYTDKITHKFRRKINPITNIYKSQSEIIFSKIMLDLNEKDYE